MFKKFSSILGIILLISLCLSVQAAEKPLYKNSAALVEERVEDLLQRMTKEEKAVMLGGDTTAFDSKPIKRHGIPALRMTDGPVGVRWPTNVANHKSTAFPAGVYMAATWDINLINKVGKAIARETKAAGRNVILAPCINIHRDPHAGRNFESFGEDPYLAARMAVNYVKGVQSEKVVATTKHFVANNQEFERNSIDARLGDRALHEIYLPAFKAAVQEGNTLAIMSAYNRLNGHYCSSNTWLLKDILKDRWGFKGFVMSDWGAVHSVIPTIYAELDIEMPNGRYMSKEAVLQAVREGTIRQSKVDDKVRRMLRTMFAMGYFDQEIPDGGERDTEKHHNIALRTAQSGIVLLKNENDILPINQKELESLAVIGVNADYLRTGGGGSSRVRPGKVTSPLEALRNKTQNMEIKYSPGLISNEDLKIIPQKYLRTHAGGSGLTGKYYNNSQFKGEAIQKIDKEIAFRWGNGGPEGMEPEYFSIRWTGKLIPPKTGRYIIGTNSDDGTRLYIEGEMVVDNWGQHGMITKSEIVELEKDKPVDIRLDYYEEAGGAGVELKWKIVKESPREQAITIAKNSDAAILFLGNSDQIETEGRDRGTLTLPEDQQKLLKDIINVNENCIVILNSGAAITMKEWIDDVPAVVEAWFPGQEGGRAVADVLLGNVNPSGKLPTTFMKEYEDVSSSDNYPGQNGVLNYEEGIFVGYRHFDKNNIEPLFPFGHGLSYTTFEYSDLKINPKKIKKDENIRVSLKVKNTGDRAGAEVVQLYLQDNKASVVRPVKELKGFSKVYLKPGEEKGVELTIQPADLKFWDVCSDDWESEAGKFTVHVGASSRDIKLKDSFILK